MKPYANPKGKAKFCLAWGDKTKAKFKRKFRKSARQQAKKEMRDTPKHFALDDLFMEFELSC